MADPARPRRRPSLWLAALLLVWGAGVAGGLHALWAYANVAGPRGAAPARWPADLGAVPARHVLIVLLHPKCPCSRATVSELARLVAQSAGHLDVRALFVRPPGAPEGWCRTPLWDRVVELDGVRAEVDEAGRLARRLGAETSGHAFLFGPGGRLQFSGGITAARGHEGDNAGKSAILARVRAGHESAAAEATPAEAPVFGCPLFDSDGVS